MLPRHNRLTRPEDFREVFRNGAVTGGTYVVLHVLQTTDSASRDDIAGESAAGVQVGFIASKKVGNAVIRHRVKRQLRHLMRERLGEFIPGARVVVRALPTVAGIHTADLNRDFDSIMTRVRRKATRS